MEEAGAGPGGTELRVWVGRLGKRCECSASSAPCSLVANCRILAISSQ